MNEQQPVSFDQLVALAGPTITTEGYQPSFEEQRLEQINDMLSFLGVPREHVETYRDSILSLFADNTRVNGTSEERLHNYLAFKIQLKNEQATG